jgi:hypothetical protein
MAYRPRQGVGVESLKLAIRYPTCVRVIYLSKVKKHDGVDWDRILAAACRLSERDPEHGGRAQKPACTLSNRTTDDLNLKIPIITVPAFPANDPLRQTRLDYRLRPILAKKG